jgi:hypothetical protein
MKSKLFMMIDVEGSPNFKRGCASVGRVIAAIPQSKLLELLQRIQSIRRVEERAEAVAEAGRNIGVEPVDLHSALILLDHIAAQLLEPDFVNDKSQDLASDLLTVSGLKENKLSEIAAVIESLKAYAAERRSDIRGRQFERAAIPQLDQFSTVVDFRPVFDRSDISGKQDYNPRVLGVVAAIVLFIETSNRSNDQFVFQITEEQLDEFMNKLGNVKKELSAARSTLKLKP